MTDSEPSPTYTHLDANITSIHQPPPSFPVCDDDRMSCMSMDGVELNDFHSVSAVEYAAYLQLIDLCPSSLKLHYSSKQLYIFLFSRQLDVSATLSLLQRNYDSRIAAHGHLSRSSFHSIPLSLFHSRFFYWLHDRGDRNGPRLIIYLTPARFKMKQYNIQQLTTFFIW